MGYSLGGRLALRVALDRPELVDALALLGATAGIEDAAARAARVEIDERLAAGPGAQGRRAFIDGWLAQDLFSRLPRADAGVEERRTGTVDGLASALRLLGTGAQEPVWDRLDELGMPVLLMAGRARHQVLGPGLPDGWPASATTPASRSSPAPVTPPTSSAPQSVATILNRFLAALPAPT